MRSGKRKKRDSFTYKWSNRCAQKGSDSFGSSIDRSGHLTAHVLRTQPMVHSWDRRDENAPAHLSLIDKEGDIASTCEIRVEARKKREIASSVNGRVCQAFVSRLEKQLYCGSTTSNSV
jgi:hypothetical protein